MHCHGNLFCSFRAINRAYDWNDLYRRSYFAAPACYEIVTRFPHARKLSVAGMAKFSILKHKISTAKQKPALILAEKYKHFVMAAPAGYGIGANRNYYFSHMLNCLYDCRYCFLQGMYQSQLCAVCQLWGFQDEIRQLCFDRPTEDIHFFSGYDCDSLALEPVTGFAGQFLPFFETIPMPGWNTN